MKNKILLLQRISFIACLVITVLFFISTIILATPYYHVYMYVDAEANIDLINYFSEDFQQHNRLLFNFSLILLIGMIANGLCKPRKYYSTFITFPIFIITSIMGIVLPTIAIVKTPNIVKYFTEYDYSNITSLVNNKISSFYINFLVVVSVTFIIISIFNVVAYILGFVKFLRGRNENNV